MRMGIPRPELLREELEYHRRQAEVLARIVPLAEQLWAARETQARVKARERKRAQRAKGPGCRCR